MARTWLSIRVDLIEGHGEHLWPRPGRLFAAARTHTFAQLADAIDDVLQRMEADASTTIADQVVAAVRSDGLGVAGLEATRRALGNGQVDLLLLEANTDVDDEQRNELIRLAAITGADVEVVEAHAGLTRFGGVGALLRYRLA